MYKRSQQLLFKDHQNKEDLGMASLQKSKETRGMPHPNSVPVHLKMQNLEMDRTLGWVMAFSLVSLLF